MSIIVNYLYSDTHLWKTDYQELQHYYLELRYSETPLVGLTPGKFPYQVVVTSNHLKREQ